LDIDAIGHRVVHGGEYFQAPVRINNDVIAKIEECAVLAPLHNSVNLE
jgi:acetate kinase